MERIADTVFRLRTRLDMSQERFGARFSVSQGTVSRWEAATQIPDGKALAQIASEAGITLDVLLGSIHDHAFPLDHVPVLGVVEAGVFRQIGDQVKEVFNVSVPEHTGYADLPREGYEVVDQSADREYPARSVLVTVPFASLRTDPKDGDHVLCLWITDAGTERTCREYHVDDRGQAWLLSLSTEPRLSGAVPAEERHVEALVIGSYCPRPKSA